MSILTHGSRSSKTTASGSSTAILDQIDLVESEAEYHWQQFEQLTLGAQQHLDLYDVTLAQRRELARKASKLLAGAERLS
jgi:hypothetical protein